LIVLLALLLLAFASPIYAQDDLDVDDDIDIVDELDEEHLDEPIYDAPPAVDDAARAPQHPLSNIPEASPDIDTVVVIPSLPTRDWPIGKPVSALVGMVNTGDTPVIVHFMMGSINSPFDFSYHVQNLSLVVVNQTLDAGEERTFEYRFMPHPNLDPIELRVAMTIFYEEEGLRSFGSTFFNETVTFFEPNTELDLKSFSKYSFGFTVGGLLIFALYSIFGPEKKRSRKKAIPQKKNLSAADKNDWLEGMDVKTRKKKRN